MKEKKIKELKDLNLMDRFLFAEVIEDKEVYEALLEIILDKDVALSQVPQAEKELRTEPTKRRAILDVCGIGDDESVYNTEVQNKNTHNLPKRSRYHNGMIDSRLLEPGTIDFNMLKDVFVILIMPFDLFGYGKFKYTFSMQSDDIPGLHLNDGITRVFLNTRGTDYENVSEELVALLKYFENTTDEMAKAYRSKRIDLIHKKVDTIKNSEEMGVKYMNAYEERILDRQEAFAEGVTMLRSALNLHAQGKTVDEIASELEITAAEAKELLVGYKVDTVQDSEEMGVKYMTAYEDILDRQEAFAEGKQEGKLEGITILKTALKLQAQGKSIEEIASELEITVAEAEELLAE